jgi:ATP-dependent DNA helicase RecQ
VVRQLLAGGLLAVQGEYGVLALTGESNEVLFEGRKVLMRREPERAARPARSSKSAKATVDLPAADVGLFERLRAWRAATAKEQGVPAYVVFHDATLREIAARKPADLAALGTVAGVGENKLARYGEGVLTTLGEE